MSSTKPKKIIKIWASSHGAPHHHLPDILESNFDTTERYEAPIIEAKPGGHMTYALADSIVEDVKSRIPQKQLHVCLVGGNNLRRHQDTPRNLLHRFRYLTNQVAPIQGAHLLLCSLIPSPGTQHRIPSDHLFMEFNDALRAFCHSSNNNASFLNLDFKLRRPNGEIKTYFFKDEVHLNFHGQEEVGKMILHGARKIPNSYFK